MNIKFNNVYLKSCATIGGKIEYEGPLSKYFDDYYDVKTCDFDQEEVDLVNKTINYLLRKIGLTLKDIDLLIGGDLSNQLAISSYAVANLDVPNIGVYSACSTVCLAIGLSAMFVNNSNVSNVIAYTSSFNQVAEKQFRNPVEYGGYKVETNTYTSTIGGCCLISKELSNIKINSFTIGKVIDVGFKDVNDFGRAMAPAAIETLISHFKSTNTKPSNYDLILTGDLSKYGHKIVKEVLEEEYGIIDNYNDCGLMIYDLNHQKVNAGGSGPGTAAGVLFGYVWKSMLNNKYKKVLLCATGILMNPTMVNLGKSLPCIAHVIELERMK